MPESLTPLPKYPEHGGPHIPPPNRAQGAKSIGLVVLAVLTAPLLFVVIECWSCILVVFSYWGGIALFFVATFISVAILALPSRQRLDD